jgi:uncharacterized protein YndB with AHSA1/START domain
MPPAYRFLDRWVVPAPIDRVYDAIGDVLGYERWWTDFVMRATGDEAPPEVGKKNELLVKAYLPYKVNFGLEVVEAERPRRILSRLSKDFDGSGEWTPEETDGTTTATLDRRPSVNHAFIRRLTRVLRPALPLESHLGHAPRRAADPRVPRLGLATSAERSSPASSRDAARRRSGRRSGCGAASSAAPE